MKEKKKKSGYTKIGRAGCAGNGKGDKAFHGKRKPRRRDARVRAFVLCYMANGHNATKAAIDAGYSPNGADVCGWQLIHTDAYVMGELARLEGLAIKKANITAEYILRGFKDVAEACRQPRIEKDADGGLVHRGVVDSSGANRAFEMLGKHLQMWVDKLDVTTRTELADVSDEDLLETVKNALKSKP